MKKKRIKKKFLIQISDRWQSRPLRGALFIPPALPAVADFPLSLLRIDQYIAIEIGIGIESWLKAEIIGFLGAAHLTCQGLVTVQTLASMCYLSRFR